MNEPREDCWGRIVTPNDHTWDTRPEQVEFCELCGVARPIEQDALEVTGLFVCVECIEQTLQGAIHE